MEDRGEVKLKDMDSLWAGSELARTARLNPLVVFRAVRLAAGAMTLGEKSFFSLELRGINGARVSVCTGYGDGAAWGSKGYIHKLG